jgi:putative ABC transport system substrate-binding protein
MLPRAGVIAVLYDPIQRQAAQNLKEVQEAARLLKQQLHLVAAPGGADLEPAFISMAAAKAHALLISSSPAFTNRRREIIALAAKYRIAATYSQREFVNAGGLMSYGASTADAYRQAGLYVARILKGARPAELPIQQPAKFELAINLKTAKALGLKIPQALLVSADTVIE